MKKTFLFVVFVLAQLLVWGGSANQITLKSSMKLIGLGKNIMCVIKPVFEQEGATLAADSANFNQQQNTFDAYGNVVITQNDGTILYADLLNYLGNTKMAVLSQNVKMVDKEGAVLTTDFLTYNANTKVGSYTNGGKVINGSDTLTSKNGYYYVDSKDAYFRYQVVITSNDALVKADSMRYNSATKMAYFYGPTYIYGKQDTMYTEDGNYNTTTRKALGLKHNKYQQGTKTLKGDTVFYDDINGYGRAVKHVTFADTGSQKIMLVGQLGTYKREDSSALITKNPRLVLITQDAAPHEDTLWLAADTMFTTLIPLKNFTEAKLANFKIDAVENNVGVDTSKSQTKDSLLTLPSSGLKDSLAKEVSLARLDTLNTSAKARVLMAYHHVKVFKSDLQAKADSAFFSCKDSIVRIYRNPMLWSQGAQISADTLYLGLKKKQLSFSLLQHNGFIASTEDDSIKFNQIKGRVLKGLFTNNRLHVMYVNGNAESVYYILDNKKYTHMNRALGECIKISFQQNKLSEVGFMRNVEGTLYDINKAPKDQEFLEGFIWKPKERPTKRDILFDTDK